MNAFAHIVKPKVIGRYNYHPPFFKTHTFVPAPFKMAGKNVAVAVDEQPPRPRPEQVPGVYVGVRCQR